LRVGNKVDDLLCKRKYCCEIQRSENRMVFFKTNLAESSKEDCGSKRAALPIMMMMMMMMMVI
jgi:hypothetical protein